MWNHNDVYPAFDVWGYSVTTDRHRPGFTALENVTPYGFRSSVREWLWEGQCMPSVRLSIATDNLYIKDKDYEIVDVNRRTRETRFIRQKADNNGRLHLELDGDWHEVGITTVNASPVLTMAGFAIQNTNWAIAGEGVSFKIDLLNKGTALAKNVIATLRSSNPGVTISRNQIALGQVAPGEILSPETPLLFHVEDSTREIVQFELDLKDEANREWEVPFEVRLFPNVPELRNVQIADGRRFRVQVGGNQTEERFLGIGNGDGIVNPGESFLVLPKDQGEFHLTCLYTGDPYVNPAGLNLRYSDYWGKYDHVGGSAKYSMPTVAANCPPGHELVFFAEYWLPNAPEHTIRRSLVRARVQGKDQTAPQARWAQVSPGNLLEAQLIEGGSVKIAKAILTRIDKPAFRVEIELNDEGKDGDRAAGDRIFSGTLPYPPDGTYHVHIEAVDESGNQGSSTFELHNN